MNGNAGPTGTDQNINHEITENDNFHLPTTMEKHHQLSFNKPNSQ